VTALTLETKKTYRTMTKLYIKGIRPSNPGDHVSVQLICSAQVSKSVNAKTGIFFLEPIYMVRNGNNGKFTFTYTYDLRDLRDIKGVIQCTVRVITTPGSGTATYKDYYFEVSQSGWAEWLNPLKQITLIDNPFR